MERIEGETARLLAAIAFATLVAFSISCEPAGIEPVAIASEDMCSFCKMAISEKQYAAELINRDGDALKFDDIGCMVERIKGEKSDHVAAYFVTDFESREWLKAEDAYYVRSAELKTPMGGGIIAFKDESRARELAANYNGSVTRFNDWFERILLWI